MQKSIQFVNEYCRTKKCFIWQFLYIMHRYISIFICWDRMIILSSFVSDISCCQGHDVPVTRNHPAKMYIILFLSLLKYSWLLIHFSTFAYIIWLVLTSVVIQKVFYLTFQYQNFCLQAKSCPMYTVYMQHSGTVKN